MRYFHYINTSPTNIFWLFLTSCFILIGAGHGLFPLFFVEFIYFPFLTDKEFVLPTSNNTISMALLGLFFFTGHLTMIISFFVKSAKRKPLCVLVSVIMIWVSVLLVGLSKGEKIAFDLVPGSIIPFLLLTLITLFIRPIDLLIHRKQAQ